MCGIGVLIQHSTVSDSTPTKTTTSTTTTTATTATNTPTTTNTPITTTTTTTSTTTSSFHISQLEDVLRRRGPDSLQSVDVHPSVTMIGAVLHLRGETLTPQPVSDEDGNWLVFNGEIYACHTESDTARVSRLLREVTAKACESIDKGEGVSMQLLGEAVTLALHGLHGPYSFAWWHARTASLWYGRDPLGRRSLVIGESHSRLILSSVAFGFHKEGGGGGDEDEDEDEDEDRDDDDMTQWSEVSAFGVHCIQVLDGGHGGDQHGYSSIVRTLVPWHHALHPLFAMRQRGKEDNNDSDDNNNDECPAGDQHQGDDTTKKNDFGEWSHALHFCQDSSLLFSHCFS